MGIAGAKLVEVPKAGHMALAEQPDIVTQAMLDWLSAVGQAITIQRI